MKPYVQIGQLDEKQRWYNFKVSSARAVVEKAIGRLKVKTEQDRKMGVLPAASKFNADVFTSTIEQNRPTGTRDICYSMET